MFHAIIVDFHSTSSVPLHKSEMRRPFQFWFVHNTNTKCRKWLHWLYHFFSRFICFRTQTINSAIIFNVISQYFIATFLWGNYSCDLRDFGQKQSVMSNLDKRYIRTMTYTFENLVDVRIFLLCSITYTFFLCVRIISLITSK